MTKEQQEIVNKWVAAGLMQPSKYWPFAKQSPRTLAKDQKQQVMDTIKSVGAALL